METKRFILVISSLTLLFCAAMIIYNFYTMPPFGSKTVFSFIAPSSQNTSSSAGSAALPAFTSDSEAVVFAVSSELSNGLININTANPNELESLPEIGEVLAQHIIDYRDTNGDFQNIDELLNVNGIGDKTFAKIKDLVTV